MLYHRSSLIWSVVASQTSVHVFVLLFLDIPCISVGMSEAGLSHLPLKFRPDYAVMAQTNDIILGRAGGGVGSETKSEWVSCIVYFHLYETQVDAIVTGLEWPHSAKGKCTQIIFIEGQRILLPCLWNKWNHFEPYPEMEARNVKKY